MVRTVSVHAVPLRDEVVPPIAQERELQQPPSSLECTLQSIIDKRKAAGLFRSLTVRQPGQVDFCSNDYIGLANSAKLAQDIDEEMATYRRVKAQRGEVGLGSTGSRLLTGNSVYYEETEQMLANFHNAEAALLMNSGFDANFALFAYMPQKDDVVIFDELVHASCREGLKHSRASTIPFKHNDVEALRDALSQTTQARDKLSPGLAKKKTNIIIAVESVYSMDGHCAPLVEICDVANCYGAAVVVDEAHGTGVFGPEGRGWAAELGVDHQTFCRVHTFGKGLGVHGAVVVGPTALYDYMVNYARPLIYSTSLPTHSLASIRCAYALMRRTATERQRHLTSLVELFHERLRSFPPSCALTSPSPIQGIVIPGNSEVVAAAQHLQRQGFHVLPIRSPTVPVGTERLRIILHVHNTLDEVNTLMDVIEDMVLRQHRPSSRL